MKAMKIALGASIVNLAALFWVTLKLPESVPVHLNINMVIDRYGSRWTIVIFGLVPVLFAATRIWLMKLPEQNKKVYDILLPILAAFLIALTWLTVLIAFQYNTPAGEPVNLPLDFIVAFPIGVLVIIMSNFMGVIKQNPWMGIRVAWTFLDETVWKKTHRLGGVLGVIGGSVICLSAVAGLLLDNSKVTFTGMIVGIVLFAGVSLVYSFVLYRKRHS